MYRIVAVPPTFNNKCCQIMSTAIGVTYFKSTVGVLKLTCLGLISTIVGLSFYSYFQSHWTFHYTTVGYSQYSLSNGYEDCIKAESKDELTYSENGVTCPKPTLELVLVAVSLSTFLLTLASCSMCGLAKSTSDLRLIKPFDILFHGLSCGFLLIGGILSIYSAYHISSWCGVKTKAFSERSAEGRSLRHHEEGNIDAVVVQLQQDYKLERNVNLVKVPSSMSRSTPDEIHVVSGEFDFSEALSELTRICKLEMLVDEKYWAAGIAMTAALLYGINLYIIYNAKSGGVVPAEQIHVRVEDGRNRNNSRLSSDKSVGTGPD